MELTAPAAECAWVPVRDGLPAGEPRRDSQVLVTLDMGDECEVREAFFAPGPVPLFWFDFDHYSARFPAPHFSRGGLAPVESAAAPFRVTAWMPLPPPYHPAP